MINHLAALSFVTCFLFLLWIVEVVRHRRNLRRIPIRVHVNGTRGKSSVTRLIAAGLREGGMRTVAKTTGTLPRLILPDGNEQPVLRISRANVIEQRYVVEAAARLGAEVLVVECMALQPPLQWLCESKLIRATHGVITNAWADHLDVMGPGEEDVARALSNMTPIGGKLFTAEKAQRDVLAQAAKDRHSRLIYVDGSGADEVSDDEMEGFTYEEHAANVALALRVCDDLGVDRATALRGMQRSQPDPGATTIHEIDFFGRWITFVNAFAANDPVATEKAWRRALEDAPLARSRIAVFNCRADRPDRSAQLARACVMWPEADHYVLIGSGTKAFVRAARGAGLDPGRLVAAEQMNSAELFELVLDLAGGIAVVVGMGNIGDHGLDIVRYFRNRSAPMPTVSSRSVQVAVASDRINGGHLKLPDSLDVPLNSPVSKVNANGKQQRLLQVPSNENTPNTADTRPHNGHSGKLPYEGNGDHK